MKIKYLFILLAAGALMFQSCDDDDNVKVDSNITAAFQAQYPNVTKVSWEKKGSYLVADFVRPDMGVKGEAWYDRTGSWYMTETDIPFSALPEPVKAAFNASEYKDWRVDDVDMLERKGMETVYVIEIEKGKEEYDLFYSADGTLIKAVPDTDNDSWNYLPSNMPTAISEFMTAKYPQAKILEVETEKNGNIEVDFKDGTVYREAVFSSAGNWLYTKTEVRKADVPQNVLNALAASEYASYSIDDIDLYNTPDKDYYRFELESGSTEIYLKIYTDGTIEK